MRILICSDIHANPKALEAVIEDAVLKGGYQTIWSLGDMSGYGRDPTTVIEFMRSNAAIALAGNHDLALVRRIEQGSFNANASDALIAQRLHLNEERAHYLTTLSPSYEIEDIFLCHGAPSDPAWRYIFTRDDVENALAAVAHRLIFCGHSHIPFVASDLTMKPVPVKGPSRFELGKTRRYVINPGSVGQPRDDSGYPSYLIYDRVDETIRFERPDYPLF